METLSSKVFVLGIDGMDPNLTKRFIEEGIMPNTKRLVEMGAQREDLHMLGGMPTVTPPMWTTLATGANPSTHGITDFWNQDHNHLDKMVYGLDSRKCLAEQMWNVSVEAGKKTLVWHWPGSSWPPTVESNLLYVVDGTNPVGVNMGTAQWEWEKIVIASEKNENVNKTDHGETEGGAGCIINNVDELLEEGNSKDNANNLLGDGATGSLIMSEEQGEIACLSTQGPDIYEVPISPATGWVVEIPDGAKEFEIYITDGLIRRPAMILKNEAGVYDTVVIYKNKKSMEPLFTLKNDETLYRNYIDEVTKENGERAITNRCVRINNLKEDGTELEIYMSAALDINNDGVFYPKSFFKDLVENVDYVQAVSLITATDVKRVIADVFPVWRNNSEWQADCINYMIENHGVEVIFSHNHIIDCMGHQMLHYCKPDCDPQKYNPGYNYLQYQEFFRETYRITDEYIGRFMHLLDDEWTILLVSDHGLISMENEPPVVCEMAGCAIPVMQQLGYVTLKKDENGRDLAEIDWTKTTAVMNRGNHIWINLKGRNATGIVELEDKYALERKIIDDLYSYRHPKTGERIFSIAMRNKDAAIFGMDGPECGDIIYFLDEGYNKIHADSWSTYEGFWGTSVAPIFVAAGKGIKKGYTTMRQIREVDVTPTVAALLGLRMPAQCEGAPVYQILEKAIG